MIDSEFERKGREMSDEIFSVITLQDLAEYFGKVNTEYKWLQEQPTHSDETDKLREELEARSVCAQVVTCNGAAILKLQAELEAANKRAKEDEQALLDYAILRVSLTERTAKAEAERDQLRAELDLYKRNLSLDAIRAIAETNSGKELHRSWRDTMLLQGRHVSAERMGWDLLPERDKQLDVQIAQDVLSDFAAYLHAQADLATAIGQNEQMLKAVGVENFPAFLARIAELERERDAAERALEQIRTINDSNGVIMPGSARDAIQNVTEQYFAQGK